MWKAVPLRRLLLCAVLTALPGCSGEPNPGADPPNNIVLIVVDTLRVDRLGGYGYEPAVTPNIDRLMERSVVFSNAYSTTHFTTPSFASILTGLDVSRHDVVTLDFRDRLDDRVVTLAEAARDAGMDTAAVSASVAFAFCNIRQGFDLFEASFINDEMPFDWSGNPEVKRKYRLANEVTDTALEYLRGRDDAPFFLLVHYYEPHWREERTPVEEELGLMRAYDLDVRFVDEQVGRLLDGMSDLGLAEETAVIFTADHGENLLDEDPNLRGHELNHQNVLRIPLLVSAPGVDPATRDELVQTSDIFTTVYEWLDGPELPYDVDGRSLAPLLAGETGGEFRDRTLYFRQSFYFVTDTGMPGNAGSSDGEWKYVAHFDTLEGTGGSILGAKLYYLTEDPRAVVDRANDFPEVAEAKRQDLLDWMEWQSRIYETPVEEGGENVEALRALGYLGGAKSPGR
jgi:arylsulfatase A-like enzyme